jgi:hypothetical protein
MNYATLAAALASRFASLTPPAGYKAITQATANPGNAIPNAPYVIVWPTEGELTYLPGQRKGEHTFLVTFYYAKSEGDVPRFTEALQQWLGVLLPALDGQMQLGMAASGVMKGLPLKWEFGTSVYAAVTYESITITVGVWTTENVTLVP